MRVEAALATARLGHPRQWRRDASPRFDVLGRLCNSAPVLRTQPQRSGMFFGMRAIEWQVMATGRESGPARPQPALGGVRPENLPCGGCQRCFQRTALRGHRGEVGKWGVATLLQRIDQDIHRRQRCIGLELGSQGTPSSTRAGCIAPFEGFQHVVAQHHIAAVREDVQLLWRGGHGAVGCMRASQLDQEKIVRAESESASAVNVFAVADAHHENPQHAVFDVGDEPVVSDPVLP